MNTTTPTAQDLRTLLAQVQKAYAIAAAHAPDGDAMAIVREAAAALAPHGASLDLLIAAVEKAIAQAPAPAYARGGADAALARFGLNRTPDLKRA
jgi:hypothetical protein